MYWETFDAIPGMSDECANCTFARRYHYGLDGNGHLIHRPDLCDGFIEIGSEMEKAA